MSGNVIRTAPAHAGSTAYINARIVDPSTDKEYVGAVLISDGKIADFGPNLFASGAPYGIESIDCRGFYLAPGVVDARVHTGEPGEEHKETLESAGIAATAGGITSLVLLPDNEPPFDDASLIEFVARRARQIKLVNMYAYGALTVGLEGKELAEMGLLAEAGAVAFTDADHAIGNAQVLRRALYYAKAFGALIVHLPQEPTLSGGHMTSGEMATRLRWRLQRLDAMRAASTRLMGRERLDRDVFGRGDPEPVNVIKLRTYKDTMYDLLTAYATDREIGRAHV